jgi:hypothetical protein
MKLISTQVLRCLLVSVALGLPSFLSACGIAVVGEAGSDGTAEGSGGRAEGSGGTAKGSGGAVSLPPPVGGQSQTCEESATDLRDTYETWRAGVNDIPELSGRTFEGYARAEGEQPSVDLTLVFDQSGGGLLYVDEPLPMPTDPMTVLCEPDAPCDIALLKSGLTYAVRGATFEENRLRFGVPRYAGYDVLCQLQTNHAHEEGCFYPYPAGEWRDIDWWWEVGNACACDADSCFPQMPSLTNVDLQLNTRDLTLEGLIGEIQVFFKELLPCTNAAEGGAGGEEGGGVACAR